MVSLDIICLALWCSTIGLQAAIFYAKGQAMYCMFNIIGLCLFFWAFCESICKAIK